MIPMIDLFAGPGGLNEGFSQLRDGRDNRVFESVGSFECAPDACQTLALRADYRRMLDAGDERSLSHYDTYTKESDSFTYERWQSFAPPSLTNETGTTIRQVRLGPTARALEDDFIRDQLSKYEESPVVIGGPPCQAYSLAGRSRRAHDTAFATDEKHRLYEEYLHFIRETRPSVFVMENVQGLLSAPQVRINSETERQEFTKGELILSRILEDLKNPVQGLSYTLHPLTPPRHPDSLQPKDFIIDMSLFGVPQARRRVIIVGIRSDILPANYANLRSELRLQPVSEKLTVYDAIHDLPPLRSGISRELEDSWSNWADLRSKGREIYQVTTHSELPKPKQIIRRSEATRGGTFLPASVSEIPFKGQLYSRDVGGYLQHQTRAHMPKDLLRYAYYASYALTYDRNLTISELPSELIPDHKNLKTVVGKNVPFADRFRVQRYDHPSSTVTSHISKDGHAYIHPDPDQMRSLTVREAARLQSFPDDFIFCGNRTQQYHQVGNAVPPLIAYQIAQIVSRLLMP